MIIIGANIDTYEYFEYVCRKKKSMVCCRNGLSLGGSVTLCKGGDAMNYVTYSDLIQFGILIVAIIALCKTGR